MFGLSLMLLVSSQILREPLNLTMRTLRTRPDLKCLCRYKQLAVMGLSTVWGTSHNQINFVCVYVCVCCCASHPIAASSASLLALQACALCTEIRIAPCIIYAVRSRTICGSHTLVNYAIKASVAWRHRCVGCVDHQSICLDLV